MINQICGFGRTFASAFRRQRQREFGRFFGNLLAAMQRALVQQSCGIGRIRISADAGVNGFSQIRDQACKFVGLAERCALSSGANLRRFCQRCTT